jgi:sugar phosphate isomerase/epimerase
MHSVIVTTSAFGAIEVQNKGQENYVSLIANAGGDGIEIRQELFTKEQPNLANLRTLIERRELLTVYSSPVEIWRANGELNESALKRILQEGIELGAFMVKTSLGNFQPGKSDLLLLKKLLLESNMVAMGLTFTVENDQTKHGGNLSVLLSFLSSCKELAVPVRMTFDIGNWHWSGEDALRAARSLSEYVVYVHCKHVHLLNGKWVTFPLPLEEEASWRDLLAIFPDDTMRGIEFPLTGEDVEETTSHYVKLLAAL